MLLLSKAKLSVIFFHLFKIYKVEFVFRHNHKEISGLYTGKISGKAQK